MQGHRSIGGLLDSGIDSNLDGADNIQWHAVYKGHLWMLARWEVFGPPVFTVQFCVHLIVFEYSKYAVFGSVWKVLKFDLGMKWESRPRRPRPVNSGWSWSWQAVQQNDTLVPFWIRAGGKWWNQDEDTDYSEQTACTWSSLSSSRWNSHTGKFIHII